MALAFVCLSLNLTLCSLHHASLTPLHAPGKPNVTPGILPLAEETEQSPASLAASEAMDQKWTVEISRSCSWLERQRGGGVILNAAMQRRRVRKQKKEDGLKAQLLLPSGFSKRLASSASARFWAKTERKCRLLFMLRGNQIQLFGSSNQPASAIWRLDGICTSIGSSEGHPSSEASEGVDPFTTEPRLIRVMESYSTGENLEEAVELLDEVLADKLHVEASHLMRGMILGMMGRAAEGLLDMDAAVRLAPLAAVPLQARADLLDAMGRREDAILDLTAALKLEPANSYIRLRRAQILSACERHDEALLDLEEVERHVERGANCDLHFYKGLALMGVARIREAAQELQLGLTVAPDGYNPQWLKLINRKLGFAYRTLQMPEMAEEAFGAAIRIDPRDIENHKSIFQLWHATGDVKRSMDIARQTLAAFPSDFDTLFHLAACHHSLGNLAEAARLYDQSLRLVSIETSAPNFYRAFVHREVAIYTGLKLQRPLAALNLDDDFPMSFKELWLIHSVGKDRTSEKLPLHALLPDYKEKPLGPLLRKAQPRNDITQKQRAAREKLVQAADELGQFASYRAQDFLTNKRQLRMAGLAALEIAQVVSAFWKNKAADKEFGARSQSGSATSASKADLSWRDVFEMVVRWRQISEPKDIVLWMSKMPLEEEYCSQTRIRKGRKPHLRYFAYFSDAFAAAKSEMIRSGRVTSIAQRAVHLNAAILEKVPSAKNESELLHLVQEPFLVDCPCYSTASPGKELVGSRILFSGLGSEEFFAICSPISRQRLRDFDVELTAAWEELSSAVFNSLTRSDDFSHYKTRVQDGVLRLAFYWYNLMPLARGSSIVGIISIVGLLLASDLRITAQVPEDVQMDFVAMLSTRLEDFVGNVSQWLYPSIVHDSHYLSSLPVVRDVLPTISFIYEALDVGS